MNHHADKMLLNSIDSDEPGSQLIEAYTCPNCGANDSRLIAQD